MIFFYQDSCCLDFWINQVFVKVNSDNGNNMKPVSVAKVYTNKFSQNLFLLKI